jgi:hypothetical protein
MLLLPLLLWPGSLLLPRAVSQVSLLLTHVESRFLIAWIVPFWLVIELVPTKLPHYPLPVVPALAVLLVCAVDAPLAGKLDGKFSDLLRRYAGVGLEWAMLAAGPVLGMAMIWVALTYGGVTGGRAFAFAMLACAAIAGALLFGIMWHRQGGIRNIAIVIACGALFHFIVIAGLFPALSRIHLARAIDAQLEDTASGDGGSRYSRAVTGLYAGPGSAACRRPGSGAVSGRSPEWSGHHRAGTKRGLCCHGRHFAA